MRQNVALALSIFLGGGLGSVARWVASGFISRNWGAWFPIGTLAVNVTGCLIIGLIATLTSPDGKWLMSHTVRTFFMLGLLGGYTTFSSFSLETLALAEKGQWGVATANVVLSVVLCLGAVWLGQLVAGQINSSLALD